MDEIRDVKLTITPIAEDDTETSNRAYAGAAGLLTAAHDAGDRGQFLVITVTRDAADPANTVVDLEGTMSPQHLASFALEAIERILDQAHEQGDFA